MTSVRQQARTLAVAVALIVLTGFAPATGLIGWSNGVGVAILAGLAVFIVSMGGSGGCTGLIISVPFAPFAGLTDWAAADPTRPGPGGDHPRPRGVPARLRT